MTSRRGFLGGAGVAAGAIAALGAPSMAHANAEPFFAPHQGGIATPHAQQTNIYFAVFDLATDRRDDVIGMMRAWTAAAARLQAGLPVERLDDDPAVPAPDSGDAVGLDPARLTLTFGFGPDLFTYQGKDRYGLAARRPAALVDLPIFPGDQLEAEKTGGAIMVQACADDPQVAFHAVRQLARIAGNTVSLKWTQTGYCAAPVNGGTPRNLMGFKDGTMNPKVADPKAMAAVVWVGPEGPAWMQGGSYMVARRIRIALQHWDQVRLGFQEQVFGRHKYSGAPLGQKDEFAPLDLDATDADGNPVIPANAHARLGAPAVNGGAQILRRAYSYSDGASFVAERWPPWKQAMEYDAGLLFICYQKDPRTGFIRIFEPMSRIDALNQFTTSVGSGIFACPPGAAKGGYIGRALFEA
ncbi:MAG TPA: Dyp-type peroxidase [Acidocella sp.]|jgi:deferrochelatase/peroxidase EfeB|uniref:Dyp-type peroxidase n=1 Tax=Acidocella sp. TaxID=50710 RepID=UPI002B98607A|nr:Dyp-type peroxidase [Acidocella sp.]HVE20966.1 Dyp-type peroxidase [Acidocella sp.]